MRYVDTGARDPGEALGTWLRSEVLARASEIAALRWQSGFFDGSVLGLFDPVMRSLEKGDGITHLLVGSNNGSTTMTALNALLVTAGASRGNLRIGVVRFDNAFFHPKTVHITRTDGSKAAYVGSANLTGSGVTGLHVEAGVLLDTADGDDPALLGSVSKAIDDWFSASRAGIYLISNAGDVTALVAAGVVNVPQPAPLPTKPTASAAPAKAKVALAPLIGLPATPVGPTPPPPKSGPALPTKPVAASVANAAVGPPAVPAETWTKPLTRSDAQRKTAGNQRGSITLVGAPKPFASANYFKDRLLVPATWTTSATRTGRPLETARLIFDTEVLGKKYGPLELDVTYDPDRASKQNNYTTLLHLGSLGPDFGATDMTGKALTIIRLSDDTYMLTIA